MSVVCAIVKTPGHDGTAADRHAEGGDEDEMSDEDEDRATVAELTRALRYVHEKLELGLSKNRDLAAHLYALTESLVAAGVVSREDVAARRKQAEELMAESALGQTEGVELLRDERDKYSVASRPIDCGARVHLCKAACCRLGFALSRQDLDEGVVRWDVGRPYRVRQRADGWCHHSDPTTRACGVHAQRPLVCRQYDCRTDPRIWEDFDDRIPNPRLAVLR